MEEKKVGLYSFEYFGDPQDTQDFSDEHQQHSNDSPKRTNRGPRCDETQLIMCVNTYMGGM